MNKRGTKEYYEWLQAYLLKRKRKQNVEDINNRAKKVLEEDSEIRAGLEEARQAAGPVFEELMSVLQGVSEPDGKNSSREQALKSQIHALMSNAPDFNLSMDSLRQEYRRVPKAEGAESQLFIDTHLEPGTKPFIIKAIDFSIQSRTPFDFLVDRVLLHNALFPNAPYQVHGFSFDNHDYEQSFRFIISQPFIKGKQPSRKQIDDFMSGLGFSKSKLNEDWYETDFLNVTDMHTKNALVDEKGNIYVIDDVIERR